MALFPGRKAIKSTRLLTAAILLPILLGIIWFLPSFYFFLFVTVLILRVQYEFYLLFYDAAGKRQMGFGLLLGLCLTSVIYFQPAYSGASLVFLLLALLLFSLFTFKEIKKTFTDSAVLFLGIVYLPGFVSHLFLIRDLPAGRGLIILALLMTWGGDAGAYYIGRSMGKHKLAPRVSPNKTVEGALGGLFTTFLGGVMAKFTFLTLLSWGDVIILSSLLGVFGQLGDLTESMLKRSAGVKDSSHIIPAHGGLFDKLDSISFAAPLLYYYMTLIYT